MVPQKLGNSGLLFCLISACLVLGTTGITTRWHSWKANGAHFSMDKQFYDMKIFNNLMENFRTKFQGFTHDGIHGAQSLANASDCLTKFQDLLINFKNMPESIAFVDAAGKPGPGVTSGNFLMLGSYEMCQSESLRKYNNYQNCVVRAGLNLVGSPAPVAITWTGCIPDECQGKGDMDEIFEELAGFINKTGRGMITTDPKTWTMRCDVKQELDAGAYAAVTIFSIIGFLVVVGTLWFLFEPIVISFKERNRDDTKLLVDADDNLYVESEENRQEIQDTKPSDKYATTNQPDSLLGRFLKCFALQRTFEILTSTTKKPGMVLCLNGIRVLSINWVVLGHSYMAMSNLNGDMSYVMTLLKRRNFMMVINALPSVDSFFAMSGFLVSYLLLKQLAKRDGLTPIQWLAFYVHRYMRLTIPYLIAILLEGFVYRLLMSGPIAQPYSYSSNKACKDNWYKNLLYINNMVPWKAPDESCIGQGWYLANDMQFFVVAPIFIVFLFRKPLLGLLGTVGTVMCSAIAAGVITAHYKLGPTGMFDPTPNRDDYWLLYDKPWVRIPPYLVGILGGWVCWRWGTLITNSVKTLPEWLKVVSVTPIWLLTAAIQYAVLFGLYKDTQDLFFDKKIASEIDGVSYEMLARTAWSLSLTIQVMLCQCGLGGFINSILSWSGWQILARLTYSVFLLHIGILTVFSGQMRHTFSFNPDFEFAVFYLGLLTMSYLAAAVLYLCVEQPVALLEGITYRSENSK